MKKIKYCLLLSALVLIFFSCVSKEQAVTDFFPRGMGDVLGSVSATATISKVRKTGETTGDTMQYGYLANESGRTTQAERLAASSLTDATEKAYAIALYDIIQQARAMGGNALNDVVSTNRRSYNLNTDTETVIVTITAHVVKTK